MNQPTITPRQLMILVVYFTVGTTILVVPTVLAQQGQQEAWELQLLGSACGMLLLWLYIQILKHNTSQNIFQMNEQLFGRWVGTIISAFVLFILLIVTAQVVSYIGSFITTQIMTETPAAAIHVLFMIVVIFGTKLGVVILARTAEIYFPWVLLLFVCFLAFIIPDIHISQLLPLGETGISAFAKGSMQVLSFSFFPLFAVFASFHSQVNWSKAAAKAYFFGAMLSGLMLLVLVVVCTSVLGPANTEVQIYPTYIMARKINIGNFFQRVEVIVAFLWFIFIFFKLILYFNTVVTGIAAIFQIPQHAKALSSPLGLLVTILSLIVYPDYVYQKQWDARTWPAAAISIGLVYPFTVLLLTVIRQRRKKNQGQGAA